MHVRFVISQSKMGLGAPRIASAAYLLYCHAEVSEAGKPSQEQQEGEFDLYGDIPGGSTRSLGLKCCDTHAPLS